jgi:hypothetical protein
VLQSQHIGAENVLNTDSRSIAFLCNSHINSLILVPSPNFSSG